MENNLLSRCFVGLIFLLGFLVCLQDLKHRKIANKWLLFGFVVGVLLDGWGFWHGLISVSYLKLVLLNTGSAFFVAYFFWWLAFWPAGDAKFFVTLVFLLPLEYYQQSYLPIFPAFILLLNIFIATGFFLISQFVLRTMAAFFKQGNMVWQKLFIFTWLSWQNFFAQEKLCIAVNDLRAGFNPVLDFNDKQIFSKDFLTQFGRLRADGLNDRQLKLLQTLFKAKKIYQIEILRNVAFSPWILFGLSLTILSRGSFLQMIYSLIFN